MKSHRELLAYLFLGIVLLAGWSVRESWITVRQFVFLVGLTAIYFSIAALKIPHRFHFSKLAYFVFFTVFFGSALVLTDRILSSKMHWVASAVFGLFSAIVTLDPESMSLHHRQDHPEL